MVLKCFHENNSNFFSSSDLFEPVFSQLGLVIASIESYISIPVLVNFTLKIKVTVFGESMSPHPRVLIGC